MPIEVCKLTKVYDQNRGLLPISLTIKEGECVAVVGHNGAGKSTFLKLLASWIIADGGNALIHGVNIGDRLANVRKIGFVPETPNLFEYFSVNYNFKLFARLFCIKSSRIDEIYKEFGLLPFRNKKVQSLSKGLKQRVSLGRALLADPPILLLDEPTSGLDLEMTQEVHHYLLSFHEARKTVVFTSHRPEEIRTLATRIIVLHGGQIVFDGLPSEYFLWKYHEDLLL